MVDQDDLFDSNPGNGLRDDTTSRAKTNNANLQPSNVVLCLATPRINRALEDVSPLWSRSKVVIEVELIGHGADNADLVTPAAAHLLAVSLPEAGAPIAVATKCQPHQG